MCPYHRKQLPVKKRSKTSGEDDDNMTERISLFHAMQKDDTTYRLPLGYFNDFYTLDQCINDKLNLTITLERDMSRLFESKKAGADDAGAIKITKNPRLYIILYRKSDFWATTFNRLFNANNQYSYGVIDEFSKRMYDLSGGTQFALAEFKRTQKQFNWLIISLYDNNNNRHRSVWNSYGGNLASSKTESIILKNLKEGIIAEDVEFKFSDDEDTELLYSYYVAFVSGSPALTPAVDYFNSPLIDDLPTKAEYLAGQYPIVPDTRQSKGI